jgi:NAD-dependent deacetylase
VAARRRGDAGQHAQSLGLILTSAANPADGASPEAIRELARLIAGARRGVAFTGAGISTESGIPDFRSPGGLWTKNRPIPFDLFVASPEARAEAWRRKFTMDDHYRGAAPNRGHRALAALVAAGHIRTVVTQNIDDLHRVSGIPPEQIVELHGNGTYAVCIACGRRHELAGIRAAFESSGSPPACVACKAPVKSATVSFGQPMPRDAMARAKAAALEADLFLVLGSSLVVLPAADLPVLARHHGARLVIINREPTELDAIADLVIHGELGEILGELAVWSS